MKLSQLEDYLSQFRKATVSCQDVGCVDEVIIRPEGGAGIVDEHFQEIQKAIQEHDGMIVYVRAMPHLREVLDPEGECDGLYRMRTRLFFGELGKCITMEQYENLKQLGAYLG